MLVSFLRAPRTCRACRTARPAPMLAIALAVLVALASASDGAELDTLPHAFGVVAHAPADRESSDDARHVLLIPGLGSPGSVWDDTVSVLTDAGYTAHVVTLAGFAGRPPIDGELLPQVRDELEAYARGLERPPAIVGHSLGGTMALWLAASAPDAVGPVVAVDGVAFLPALGDPSATVESARAQAEQMREMLGSMSQEQADQQAAMTLSTMITDPETVRRVAEASRGSDPATLAQAVHDLMTRDLRPALTTVDDPVLLLAAGAAAPTAEIAAMLAARYADQVVAVPDHRVEVVDGARHFIMLDRPEAFHALLLEHLAGGSAASEARR
ncbi:MAG: alpha/beta hydrolase [Acidobacteriota bacterium]